MKKGLISLTLSLFSFFLLTGCWDKFELTEWGFVQGIAIDQTKDGKFELTTQFYKPKGGGPTGASGSGGEGQTAAINITTKDDSIFEAIRDISIHLGRKPMWSHLRVILISEQVAKKKSLGDVLDFFYRSHETRLFVPIIITKDKASDYLKTTPFIENTVSQQIGEIQKYASRFTAKVAMTDLLDLGIQLKSEVSAGIVPYLYFGEKQPKETLVVGNALIKKGKMAGTVAPKDVEGLLMLSDRFQSGIIQIPCSRTSNEKNKRMETMEVFLFNVNVKPNVKGDSLKVDVSIQIAASTGELYCSDLTTTKGEQLFLKSAEAAVEEKIKRTVKLLQDKKVDVIGIGNKIYSQNPQQWKTLRDDWDELFSGAKFNYHIEVELIDTKMDIGKPIFSQ